jgi:2,4-dienoyl-CoA reductase-like NADH-dependent reductase (Old Yellow Enzyme family)
MITPFPTFLAGSVTEAINKAHPDIIVGTVGMITAPQQANDLLAEGKADHVLLAREFLRDPHFVLRPPMNWASL